MRDLIAVKAAAPVHDSGWFRCRTLSCSITDRDYQREPVADSGAVTDLSATEMGELGPKNFLRSTVRGVVELQCIM
jgi:hypothetical protein